MILSTVYTLKWAHSLRNLPDPSDNVFVKNLLKSANRTLPKSKKEAVTSDNLITLCTKYSHSSDVIVLRDLSMMLIAFSGFLWFDELSSIHCNDMNF